MQGSSSPDVDICFVGPFPPPTHGMANVNREMAIALSNRTSLRLIPVNPNSGTRGLRYHLTKSLRALAAFPRIANARLRGARVYYASVDDGLGGVWTCSFTFFARLLGYRIYLHHHSFRYIDVPSPLMRAIVNAAGSDATHVALCNDMVSALRQSYPCIQNTISVPNCTPLPESEPPDFTSDGPFVIGLLSNLLFEKGVREFVDILRRASRMGISVRGVLAGPAPNTQVEQFLKEVLAEPGLPLEWRGPLAGADKRDFFHSIDLFVFPTRYRTEAYPLVLLEALVHGVPIVAPRLGCIGALDGLDSAVIVPPTEDFVESTLRILGQRQFTSSPETRRLAFEEGERLNRENAAARNELIDRLVASS